MKAYLNAFKNYATFNGRTSRKDFWIFIFINALVTFALNFLGPLIGATFSILPYLPEINSLSLALPEINLLSLAYSSLLTIPCLAITVRRLHDAGKSGWMMLINLIPIVGPIWYLVLLCKGSQDINNQYGESQI